MMPRLLTWGAKGTGNPSMMMGGTGVCCGLVRLDLEPMSRASFFWFFFTAPDVIQAGDEGGGWVGLAEM